MAKKNVKIKGVWFNLDLEQEVELCQYADKINFSEFVKQKLIEHKRLKEQGPAAEPPELDTKEIAALVENIVEIKLAGRIVATDHETKETSEFMDVDEFF